LPRAEGSETLGLGDPAPRFTLPLASDPEQLCDIPARRQWQLLIFLRHTW